MSCCDSPGLLPLEQALQYLANTAQSTLAIDIIPIGEALDRVLAQDCKASHNIPNYDNSAMDGYALHCNSFSEGLALRIVGKSLAGSPYEESVLAGECVRIMTGAQVPNGCNCVVMQENTRLDSSENAVLYINKPVKKGENIRLEGNDVRQGSLVLPAGKRLGPMDIGMLASLGKASIAVRKKLQVAVFSTGDELAPLGENLANGQVYDSNRQLIMAMLKRLNVDILDLGCVADSPQKIEQALTNAAQKCDAIVTSGGVSVGEADFTRDILHKIGDIHFYKIAMKPGKPFAFGKIGNAYFFGLPGNPVSAAVTFHQLAIPALRQMSGEHIPTGFSLRAQLSSPLKKRPGRVDFQRGLLSTNSEGQLCASSTGQQSSGALSSMVTANTYIKLEQHDDDAEVGDYVTVIPFDRWLL